MITKRIATLIACSAAVLGSAFAINDFVSAAPQNAEGESPQPVTASWDYADENVMNATMALSGSSEPGTVASCEGNLQMTVVANGVAFRNNGNNIQVREGAEFRIPVISTEDVVTVDGYPGYSYYTISGGEELNGKNSYQAKYSDVERGYVSVVSTNSNNYYYSLKVEQSAPKAPATLDGEAVSASFTFDLGTEGQTAVFSLPDYFISSKVSHGDLIFIEGKDNKKLDMTWFGIVEKRTAACEENAIRFTIQPNFGLVFTPTKVSFETTRFGTDGGLLDIAWENPDKTTVPLASAVKPLRDSADPNVLSLSYDVAGATPAEGACGLLINLYSLDPGKRVGFRNIVIEGSLSGTEKEIPILASFSANGVEYSVEDIFKPEGEDYVATIELAAAETMISEQNPLADVTARKGTVGTVSYEGDADKCVATIPVSLGEISINYIANFVRKPFFTVSYFDTDSKTLLGSQEVEKDAAIGEFAVDFNTATADEGYKVRGWFDKPAKGSKVAADYVITQPASLYAIATEIETASTHKKYEFNLREPGFDPADHEAFNTENGYFHDTTHGWAFKNGDVITLLTGPKASVSISLCRYGYGTNIKVTDANGNEVAVVPAKSTSDTDGEVVSFNYEGDPGLLTLTFESEGELYIHYVKILNNAEVNFESQGQWYFVKPGDAGSLIDVLDAVNAANSSRDAARSFIYIPDGLYDLRDITLTNIYGHNISLIGQSMEGTVIRNAPHYTTEGIGTTATLMNTGSNLYIQDLTIRNDLDYYAAQDAGLGGGRAVALWDKGVNTIAKNVALVSCQDTYYTNNTSGTYYWETSDIHGTVDFICGEGTMFMEKSTLTVEKRKRDGSGECTITAPATAGTEYGYVFNNCTIVNHAQKFNYGRAWSNKPRCAYLNTIHTDNKLNANRWTAQGMNVAADKFVEYRSLDTEGNVISPDSHVMSFNKGSVVNEMETILTETEAAAYAIDKVFPDWRPDLICVQIDAPKASLSNGMITWEPVEGASAYALFSGDTLVAVVTDGNSYAVADASGDWSIRSANSQGGLGAPAEIATSSVGVLNVADADKIFDLNGVRVLNPQKGRIYIVNGKKVSF